MDKSPEAFRTISEAAEQVGVPTHVLRFWESRFVQVKPVKRAGGRRYYRPQDVDLLVRIRELLHDQGMTIRGVQKLLREGQVRAKAVAEAPVEMAVADEPVVQVAVVVPDVVEPVELSEATDEGHFGTRWADLADIVIRLEDLAQRMDAAA